MLADAAGVDLRVFRRHTAKGDQQFTMLFQRYPRGLLRAHHVHVHENARQQCARRAEAVGAQMRDIAADAVHKTMHLALRVMKAPCARPAVGAGENRAVAVLCGDTFQFRGNEIECFVPAYVDEGFRTAQVTGRARATVQITFAHRRVAYPQRALYRAGQRVADGRGIRVAVKRRDAGDHAVFNGDVVDAPVR